MLELNGRITEDHRLEIELPDDLPVGEVRVYIEFGTDADDAKWEALFADPRSEVLLTRMAAQARKAKQEGRIKRLPE
jgi:hypothetical protein